MPKTSKIKKKVKKTKTKPIAKPKAKVTSKPKTKVIASKPKEAIKGPIKISRTYEPKDTENICVKNIKFFSE